MHFSENPPPSNVEASQEEVPQTALTRGSSNDSVAENEAGAEASDTTAMAQEVNRTPGSTTNEEMCERIRANIQTLSNSPQIRRVDPDTGEVRMMDDTEQQQELERTRDLEQQHC